MTRRPAVSFPAETAQRFQFLVDEYGLAGPDYDEVLLPSTTYRGTGLMISIHFHVDPHDSAGAQISVSVQLSTPEGPAHADLAPLVEAAVFAPRHRVATKAHTAEAMRATLDDNATWIRRLWPVLAGPDALDTIRHANRWETDRAGNPKRRPKNVTWKYGSPGD